MSALRKTDLPTGPGPQVGGRPPTRRPSAGRPAVGAASQTRRNLQRDLARREASLRISRRVSGPAGGISRPPLRDPEAGLELAPSFDGPIGAIRAVPAPEFRAQKAPRESLPRPAARVAPQTRRPEQPNRRVASPARPAQPISRVASAAAARAFRPTAPVAGPVARSAMPFGVPAVVALPQPVVAPAPKRSPLIALPGGAIDAMPIRRRLFSTPAMLVASIILIVVTVGAIVALQIQKTQVTERMGADMASITRYQQSTTALREQISRQVSGARIDGEVTRRGMIEPEVTDSRYLRAGNRAATAIKAAEALEAAPSAAAAATATVGAVTGMPSDAPAATTPTGAVTTTTP